MSNPFMNLPDEEAPASANPFMSLPNEAPQRTDWSRVPEETWLDKAALMADRGLNAVGEVADTVYSNTLGLSPFNPSHISRQDIVNFAGGASEMGGLLKDNPRAQSGVYDPNSGWATGGRVLDPVANAVGGGVYSKIAAAKRLASTAPLLRNSIAGAGSGAAVGTMSGDPENVIKGAAIGAALPGVFAGLGYAGKKVYDTARNLAAGAEGNAVNYLNKVFAGNKEAVIEALNSLRGIVPGERPTAGLAAVTGPESITALKALEEGARDRAAQSFVSVDKLNQNARLRPIEEIAAFGRAQPAKQNAAPNLSPAERARKNVTGPMYAEADNAMVPVGDELAALLNGPEIQGALAGAERGLGQEITNAMVAGQRIPNSVVPRKVTYAESLPEWGPAPATQEVVKPAQMSIGLLQKLKGELDTLIPNTSDATQRLRLERARAQLNERMRAASPEYAVAQDNFRRMSEPQNQADVAQVYLNAMQAPSGAEREAAFLLAERNAAQTVKKAGVPRFQEVGQIFSPTQMDDLGRVSQSMKREADYNRLQSGKHSLPELVSAATKLEGQAVPWFNPVITAARHIAKRTGANTDEAAQALIDQAIHDPKALAALLKKVPPAQRNEAMNFFFQKMKEAGNSNIMGMVAGQGRLVTGDQ